MKFRLEHVPAPPSKKNRQLVMRRRDGRRFIRADDSTVAAEQTIAMLARAEVGSGVLWPSEDVRVEITHHARNKTCTIEVEAIGPRPKGFTGRKRDISNLSECILDALQRVVFANDNQVCELVIRRDISAGDSETE